MRSAKGTGSDPGSTACEAAGDVDAWPRLRPHPGLPSLGAPLHLLAQALEWAHDLEHLQDRPRWRGAFRMSRACRPARSPLPPPEEGDPLLATFFLLTGLVPLGLVSRTQIPKSKSCASYIRNRQCISQEFPFIHSPAIYKSAWRKFLWGSKFSF